MHWCDGVLLTLTKDVVDWWTEYFEDLLDPTDMPSGEKAGSGDPGMGFLISRTEVAEVVKNSVVAGPRGWMRSAQSSIQSIQPWML